MVPDGPARNEPPDLPAVKTAGFDTQIQREGANIRLRRLDAPAGILVGYRGKTYAATVEAIACLLAFCGGIGLLGASRQTRFAYFAFVGLGALIVAGAVNPRVAGLWNAIYLGVFLAALVWLGCSLWSWVRNVPGRLAGGFRRKTPPPKPPRSFYPPAAGGTTTPTP
jgi:hypothetical protein